MGSNSEKSHERINEDILSKFRNIFQKKFSEKLHNLVLQQFTVEMNMVEPVGVDWMHQLYLKHCHKDVSVRQLILAFISMRKMINEKIYIVSIDSF